MSSATGSSAAKVYAEALFQLATEAGCVENYGKSLQKITALFSQNKELYILLGSPALQLEERRSVLKTLFKERLDPDIYGFLGVLIEKHRIELLEQIVSCYSRQQDMLSGIIEIMVTTATTLSAKLKKQLSAQLTSSMGGRKVRLIERVDPSIIGGIIVDFKDTQLDASVRHRLDDIHAHVRALIA